MTHNKQSLRIVFMGTPEFAVASLEALLAAGFNVVAVVTVPDKPAGRGLQLQPSAVKLAAEKHGLPVLQPEKLRDPAFLEKLDALKPDLQVVVAFKMLPEMVWNRPPLGTINVHGSLLPQYRGAAPINWALINGEKETGVTTFQLQHAIDTGHILFQEKIALDPDTTAGELHDEMKMVGAQTLVKTLEALVAGQWKPIPQDQVAESNLKHAPKIHTETCQIDTQKSAAEVHNLIRGLSPFPGAFTHWEGKLLKVYRTEIDPEKQVAPGQFMHDKKMLWMGCKEGALRILDLQLQGKKRMTAEAFLNGLR